MGVSLIVLGVLVILSLPTIFNKSDNENLIVLIPIGAILIFTGVVHELIRFFRWVF